MIKRRFAVLAITLAVTTSSGAAQDDPAATLFARGDFLGAAAAYQAVLRSHPADVSATLGLGTIRLYQNDLAAAAPLLRAVGAAAPADARVARLLKELERRKTEAGRPTSVPGGQTSVAFLTADPLPVVRGIANGQPGNFILDTGADVDLEPSFAAKARVKSESAGSGVFAGGKRAPVSSGMLGSLALGGATAENVPVHVLPTHAATLFPQLPIDGIIGTTYFERFLATIDYPNRRLILRARSSQSSAAFESWASSAHAAIVPCYLVGDHFVMAQAQVNAASPGLFLFDSGLAGGGVMPSAQLLTAAGIALEQNHASTGYGGGGAVTDVPFTAQRIAVGSAVQQNVRGIYTPEGSPFGIFPFIVWGAISNDFLAHYAYTVDFDAMKIVLAPSSPPDTSRALQQIYDAAFRRWQSYPVPNYVIWTATWNIRARPMGYYTGEKSSVEVHRYAVRLSDGMENGSDPPADGRLPPALIGPEFLGPFAWSLRSSVRIPPAGSVALMQPDVEGLKTIASVVAVAKLPYDIRVAGVDDVDGRPTYHIVLRPLADPLKHNLRDLWIDTRTYDLRKAHFVGTYAPTAQAPSSSTDVIVYFRAVLNCWVVSRAVWTYDNPPIAYQFDVQNDEVGLVEALPNWLFDAAQYRQRQDAGESDYLGVLLERLRAAASPAPAATSTPNG